MKVEVEESNKKITFLKIDSWFEDIVSYGNISGPFCFIEVFIFSL